MVPENNVQPADFWNAVYEFEDHYVVNQNGQIAKVARIVIQSDGMLNSIQERMLKTRINNWGYEEVRLRKDNKTHTRFVHRLVAQSFLPNPDNKPYVNHKNGKKTDNRCENLEWVSHKENIQHAYDTGLIPRNKGGLHHMATKVINYETGEVWETIQDAAKSAGVNYNTLRHQLKTQGVSSLPIVKVSDFETNYPISSN